MKKFAAAACLLSVALASLAQLGLVASVSGSVDACALPLLPLAALAAWAAVRGPVEAWAGLLPAPLLLGLTSDERVGWFIIALAPTPLIAVALRGPHNAARTIGVAACTAAAGLAIYAALLEGVAGSGRDLLEAPSALGRALLLTCLLAALVSVVLLPFRPRERGLFG
ncbi:MAG: hypothetical protein EXR66_06800 [Dehalococcoidia bacterium]|nr:hypothetical protein [Dehalococcoidia bacterium]